MKLWNHYHMPTSLDEAAALLRRYDGRARIIAGGTDLLVDMKAEAHAPFEALVDVTRIPELQVLDAQSETILIGAGVTHTRIVASAALAAFATCLVESCGVIGGPQVRNVGTLGGNVAHALPAGDGTTSLVALDAEADILQNGQRRWLTLRDLFVGPGQSLLDPARDLLVGFRFRRAAASESSAFKRVMRPQGVALPILGCAVWVRLDERRERFQSARVCIAPAGPIPLRIEAVEQGLADQLASPETIEQAVALAQANLKLRTSKYRATAEYREEMAAVLLRRTLALAVERARAGAAVPEAAEV
jgi:carbon-monoxide dehydrogenase medium subunit